MTHIPVSASKTYTITVGHGVLAQLGQTVCAVTKAKKVCIVSDSNVFPLYGDRVRANLRSAGLTVFEFVFPAGESSKNATVYLELVNFLSENSLTRSDCIIALGGGVAGDLAGFAAATYLRGIPYIQLPTTLLAMVDSSIGGKTAIDLPAGKNLCGAFWQPGAVLCDIDTLSTLPEECFRDGCAEVIKYALAYDPNLFAYLEQTGPDFDREAVICKCIDWKRKAVEQDELDHGLRRILNLGHTVGHAIESCSHYKVSHGRAIGAGMAIVARAAACQDADRICRLLTKFCLPTTTVFSAAELAKAAFPDKKRSGDTLDLILPSAIGDCRIVATPVDELQAFIEKGL